MYGLASFSLIILFDCKAGVLFFFLLFTLLVWNLHVISYVCFFYFGTNWFFLPYALKQGSISNGWSQNWGLHLIMKNKTKSAVSAVCRAHSFTWNCDLTFCIDWGSLIIKCFKYATSSVWLEKHFLSDLTFQFALPLGSVSQALRINKINWFSDLPICIVENKKHSSKSVGRFWQFEFFSICAWTYCPKF